MGPRRLTMPAPKPEVWCASTADAPVVVLTIPGVLDRTRVFDELLKVMLRRTGQPNADGDTQIGMKF